MGLTAYQLGAALERRVRDDFTRAGFFALRSPQSRSPVDILAIARGRVVFVQCKRGGSFRPAEWNTFLDLCESVGAEPVLASCPTGRGTVYQCITGRKDGKGGRQPLTEWELPRIPLGPPDCDDQAARNHEPTT